MLFAWVVVVATLWRWGVPAAAQEDNRPPKGFFALFNGKDLSGWHGEQTMNPEKLAAMPEAERKKKLAEWNEDMRKHWSVRNGELINDGKGVYLTTDRAFSDAEFWIDWKIVPGGDSGVYLRATPQVQIWDPDARPQNAVGSGGLYNNKIHRSTPLVRADNPVGQWNRFR
ncbi:MAG: DUF1080 domain-containing protein, partial [Planctomycetota bacterium]